MTRSDPAPRAPHEGFAVVLVALIASLACAAPGPGIEEVGRRAVAHGSSAYPVDAGPALAAEGVAAEAPAVDATDACAQFNRQQKGALSVEEHMRAFGCPPCPCACVNGQVTCAPCAACGAFSEGAKNLIEPPDPLEQRVGGEG